MPGDVAPKTGGGYTKTTAPGTPVYTPPPPPPPKPKAGTTTTKSTTTKTTTAGGGTTTQGGSIDAKTLAVDYGFALAVFNSNPELKKLFTQAVAQTWTVDKFTAELRGTQWFKHTSDTAREWAILAASDPQTAAQRRQARTATIRAYASSLGVPLTSKQLADTVNKSLMFGWTDQMVQQVLGAGWKYIPTTAQYGLGGQAIDQIKKTAADYAIPLSNSTIQDWGQRIVEGLAKPEDFTNYAINQAKSLFPTMAAELDKGVTVAQYADPYKQSAAQILGINPEDFNLMDPKWRASIDQVDPKTGGRTVMSLADWQTRLRSNSQYGYDKTASARQEAAGLIGGLGQLMGAQG